MRTLSPLKKAVLASTTLIAMILATSCVGDDTKPLSEDQIDSINQKPTTVYGGARSSYYGFENFPTPQEFGHIITNISKELGSNVVPSSVWIVGGIGETSCNLEFPNESGKTYTNIGFAEKDKHEAYLSHFDSIGAEVFLQVEAGQADMKDLITLVLSRYKDHPSVAGFGIDVEWFPSVGETNGGAGGTKLTNIDLIEYDKLVKSFNPKFRIFVKHWTPEYCGDGPVSDVIYVDDSQTVPSLDDMVSEFADWAKYFYPNDVGFQVGYSGDYKWWGSLENPIKEIGDALKNRITDQIVHFYWVDFTLHYDELKYVRD